MIYICGMGHVSPLASGNHLPQNALMLDGNLHRALEPDYTQHIDPRQLRRMARIIKMSVAAANTAMTDAGIKQLDAIITGTGLGCIEDTQEFLRAVITDHETLLSPTAFIKSTHNTIGGQIALLGNHYCYNMTYAHRAFSFESALLDGILTLQEGTAENVLVGGMDELTDVSIKLLQRSGCIAGPEKPTAPKGGEGAVFLALSNTPGPQPYAKVEKVFVCHSESPAEALQAFLQNAIVDFVLTGANTPSEFKSLYKDTLLSTLPDSCYGFYKYHCGEYHTASAVGTLLAALMLKENHVPQHMILSGEAPKDLNRILLYHRSRVDGHAFILLSK